NGFSPENGGCAAAKMDFVAVLCSKGCFAPPCGGLMASSSVARMFGLRGSNFQTKWTKNVKRLCFLTLPSPPRFRGGDRLCVSALSINAVCYLKVIWKCESDPRCPHPCG